ncbi:MAG TPA: hypothetical protein VKE96_12505 [Vicinamibacterales bacterium]|nr:hypothetical protein [Vicinamibacterales bacterium]
MMTTKNPYAIYEAVAAALHAATGWRCTVEGPHCPHVLVAVPTGEFWCVGDALETWGADHYASQDALEHGMPSGRTFDTGLLEAAGGATIAAAVLEQIRTTPAVTP